MNAQPENRARANLPVPSELHRRLKARAALLGIPLSRLAADALETELQRLERLQQRRREGA